MDKSREFVFLMMCKSLIMSNQIREDQDHFRTERAILGPLLADDDFAAHPFYWNVARDVVHELGSSGWGGAIAED
jgi:hypothetical protein